MRWRANQVTYPFLVELCCFGAQCIQIKWERHSLGSHGRTAEKTYTGVVLQGVGGFSGTVRLAQRTDAALSLPVKVVADLDCTLEIKIKRPPNKRQIKQNKNKE